MASTDPQLACSRASILTREFPTHSRWHGALVFIAFFSLFLATSSPRMLYFGDGGFILEIAGSILDRGIGPVPLADGGINKNKWGLGQVLLDLFIVELNRAGQSGPSDLRVFYTLGVAALPAAVSASAPLLIFLIAIQLGYQIKTAVLSAYAVGLGTITWVYSQTLFSEPAVAMGWLSAILGLVSYARTQRKAWLSIAGIGAGFSVLAKSTSVMMLPLAVLYTVVLLKQQFAISSFSDAVRSSRSILIALLALIAPMLAALGVSLWYNYARYGNAFEAGYSVERDGSFGFNTPIIVGLFGLVLSTGKGFFFYSPTALLGIVNARFFRAHRKEAVLLWAMIAGTIAAHMKWWAWHGDWSWGPRFLVPLTPLFGLLSLGFLETIWNATSRWRHALKLAMVSSVVLCAIAVQTLGLCFEPAMFLRLVSDDARVFAGGFYNESNWPIRDDGVAAHFIPEFSPLAGHAWMLRVANAHEAKPELLAEPPWATLNPRWVPRSIGSFNPEIQLWWAEALRAMHPHRVAVRVLAWALLFIFVASTAWLVGKLVSERNDVPAH
ncbi:MAG TPA: phospholipid carrier-dependent glycosyltransferase [Polyangiales bacterium]|nr:phospholipid carrier-dependent glycosyltransferase [Polyangiales bacterium]